MRYNAHLGQFFDRLSNRRNSSKESSKTFFARVAYVVHDENSRFYKENGKIKAINGIKYRPLLSSNTEGDLENLPFAYSGNANLISVPLIDEIVKITEQPSELIQNVQSSGRTYYTRIVNIWNNPVHNALPSLTESSEAKLGTNLLEPTDIRNLQSFPGDVYIEGRLGQSIRFSGFNSEVNPFTDESNNSKPITIIRNGQKVEEDIEKAVVEDINLDDSSIYLTSDHRIPIFLARQEYNSFESRQDQPTSTTEFKGRQILIDSGRLVFNAKDNDILLSSQEITSISSKTINLDGNSYIGLDAPRIYLGNQAAISQFAPSIKDILTIPTEFKQPVIRGVDNEIWMNKLLDIFQDLLTVLSTLPPNAAGIAGTLASKATSFLTDLENHRTKLPSIKSTKVYTE